MGEECVDTGGPRREFWRLFVCHIKDAYFVWNGSVLCTIMVLVRHLR